MPITTDTYQQISETEQLISYIHSSHEQIIRKIGSFSVRCKLDETLLAIDRLWNSITEIMADPQLIASSEEDMKGDESVSENALLHNTLEICDLLTKYLNLTTPQKDCKELLDGEEANYDADQESLGSDSEIAELYPVAAPDGYFNYSTPPNQFEVAYSNRAMSNTTLHNTISTTSCFEGVIGDFSGEESG